LESGLVFDIRRFSIHDGPGIRTTVFFKGCPLRCAWCHNPESQATRPEMIVLEKRCIRCGTCVEACPKGAITWTEDGPVTDTSQCDVCGTCVEACVSGAREIAGREVTTTAVMSEIERDTIFYETSGGGATFSGGEPLLQPGFLLALLRACKEKEIHTVVDTCGYAPWEVLNDIRNYTDLFLYDLKLIDDAKHREYTGVSNRVILKNLETLSRHGHNLIVRVPVIPGVTDSSENIHAIGAFVAGLPAVEHVDILGYHEAALGKYRRLERVYSLPDVRPPTEACMAGIAEALRQSGLSVKIGG